MIPFALIHLLLARTPVEDSARVVAGRLVVEPLGISFSIPPKWLDTTVFRPVGPACDLRSPSARTVNTDRAALRTLAGPSTYFGDHHHAAIADSVFSVPDMVAHLGGSFWRECDNSEADLQMRVYVSDSPIDSISRRVHNAHPLAFPGYSAPVVRQPRDSAGWRIDRLDWTFNCGDCIFPQSFEVYSRRLSGRTLSLVFMRSSFAEAATDMRLIMTSLKAP